MGSTEPPSILARGTAHEASDLALCTVCGLPYEDGPHGSGTAGCLGCDPTVRLRARWREARRSRGSPPTYEVAGAA